MKRFQHTTGLLAGLAIAGVLAAQDKPAPKPPMTAEQALAKAQKQNKRALLTLLAADDARSEALAKALKSKDLGHLLLYEYVQGEVRPLAEANLRNGYAAKFGVKPEAASMPALVVADAEGNKLAAFGPKDLFGEGNAVDTATLAESLKKLACEPLDGEKVLADALAAAKKVDKRLLLTFDAPW
jgi:hypothetical protein